MFEGVLYFVLGFLAAALIALMVSPAIWNRAVILTKRRIESSVPLTLNEVQADKDQLRAEFAMSTRRLELSVSELQEKASRQLIEINRKRDELTKLAADSREKLRTVEELEARSTELRSKLADREEALADASRELQRTREKLEDSAIELERTRRLVSEAREEADAKRIELVAKQTNLEDLSDRTQTMEDDNRRLVREIEELRTALKKQEAERDNAGTRARDGEERLSRLLKTNADLEDKLQKKEREVAEMRASSNEEGATSNQLTRELMKERENATRLEAKLAKTALRMEALLQDASNENVNRAVETMNSEKADLRKKLKAMGEERESLVAQIKAMQGNAGAEWESERKENAILRERMNDLAAQVTAMTAALEGPGSPINEILAKAEKEGNTAKSAGKPSGGTSLADRVRALQEQARIKQA